MMLRMEEAQSIRFNGELKNNPFFGLFRCCIFFFPPLEIRHDIHFDILLMIPWAFQWYNEHFVQERAAPPPYPGAAENVFNQPLPQDPYHPTRQGY